MHPLDLAMDSARRAVRDFLQGGDLKIARERVSKWARAQADAYASYNPEQAERWIHIAALMENETSQPLVENFDKLIDDEFGGYNEFVTDIVDTARDRCTDRRPVKFRAGLEHGLEITLGGPECGAAQIGGIELALLQWAVGVSSGFTHYWWVGIGGGYADQTFHDGDIRLWRFVAGENLSSHIHTLAEKAGQAAQAACEEEFQLQLESAWARLGKHLYHKERKQQS